MALATAPTMASKREALMKQREKERLERLLALMYGSRYPLHWTYDHTSYFDGKACYVKYDVQTENHREFTEAEKRAIRQWAGFHERGHEHHDCLEDYIEWIKEHSSNDFKEWQANEKFPREWVRWFGNVTMDGRMENIVTSNFPTQADYFDFGNYEWRFGIRGEHSGEYVISDFRECFMHRALGMEDIEAWEVEVINLVDAIQDDIDRLRRAATTQDCLDITLDIIKIVWPQLMEWMDIQETDYNEVPSPGTPVDDHDDENMSWASREEAEANSLRAFKKAGIKPARHNDSQEDESEDAGGSSEDDSDSSEHEDSQEPEQADSEPSEGENEDSESTEQEAGDGELSREEKFKQLIDSIQKQIEKEVQEMEAQEAPFEKRKEEVTIPPKKPEKQDEGNEAPKPQAHTESVIIKPYPNSDLPKYNTVKSEVSSQIGPLGRAMMELLEGEPDQFRRNQKKGRLRVNSVWKAQKCENINIYDRTIKGTPAKNAVVVTQFDNSYSTWGEVVEQMQKAAVLITEACEKAKVPHYSYAFTDDEEVKNSRDYKTMIFPLKPTNQLTNREKGYIGGMHAIGGNRDTLVLQWTVDQIAKQQEDIKLLIMVSDGIPNFKAGVEDETTMRTIVQKAEKQGIDVLCLFVGDHAPETIEYVRYMYNNHVISVESNIAREMSKQIKRIIRKRRS